MWSNVTPEEKQRRVALMQAGKDEEWKKHISEAMTGRKLSPEHAAKVRAANLGKKKGPHSLEVRQKMSAGKKNKKRIEARKAEAVLICNSITEAAKLTETSVSGVSMVASGKISSCKGWTFRYLPFEKVVK
jgi:hypothetical protein